MNLKWKKVDKEKEEEEMKLIGNEEKERREKNGIELEKIELRKEEM